MVDNNYTREAQWLTPRRIDGNIVTIMMSTISEKEKRFRREINELFSRGR